MRRQERKQAQLGGGQRRGLAGGILDLGDELRAKLDRVVAEHAEPRAPREDLVDAVELREGGVSVTERGVDARKLEAEERGERTDGARQPRQKGSGTIEIRLNLRPVAK